LGSGLAARIEVKWNPDGFCRRGLSYLPPRPARLC
jgi:hypothetical protein